MNEDGSLGAAKAIIYKVQTTVDGGARLTLDVGSDSQECIRNLFDSYMNNERLIYCSFFQGLEDSDGW